MQQTMIPELDKLYGDVLSYRTGEAFAGMMDFVRKFPGVAPYNAMLLHMQLPGCQLALTAEDWVLKYRRTVKLNARPLIILRTFGPISFVFDILDTEGKEVPDNVLHPCKAVGKVTQPMINNVILNMLREGVRYSQGDHAGFSGGYIAYDNIPEKVFQIQSGGKLINIWTIFEIVINKNDDLPLQFASLIHELGHFYCGHCRNPRAKWLPKRGELSSDQMEFEAESVSWLVCERLGIRNFSEGYLAFYVDEAGSIPEISVDAIMRAVGKIEHLMQGGVRPRKELVIAD